MLLSRVREVPWRELKERHEASIAFVAFLGGVVWDALTLVRIDRLADLLFLAAYLLGLCVLLVLEARTESEPERWPRLAPQRAWLLWGSQFFFGGLFSAQLVFYARAASWGPQLAYVLVLAVLLLANEFFHQHLRRQSLRLALLWLVSFTYFLFLVPVLTRYPGTGLFSVAALLATTVGLVVAAATVFPRPWPELRGILARRLGIFAGMAVLLAVLEYGGFVPPVPLAAMEIGIFHDVRVVPRPPEEPGPRRQTWRLVYEKPPFWAPFRDDDRVFRWREGEAAHCFTAIFAPTGVEMKVFHVWEQWDPEIGWRRTDRIDVTRSRTLVGGADRGFRTFSRKARLAEGPWRCRAVTADDREIARVVFHVQKTNDPPHFVERTWE